MKRQKKKIVFVGDRFGRLCIKSMHTTILRGVLRRMAVVVCDCGMEKIIRSDGLTHGRTRSCGCLNLEIRKKVCKKRNKTLLATQDRFSVRYPKTYRSWRCVLSRCYNKKQLSYPAYGGVGIFACDWFREKPQNLVELIGKAPSDKHTLDRFPIHDGNYTCGRCKQCGRMGWEKNIRWATRKEQSNNRGSFNIMLTAYGKTMTLGQWRDLCGINDECLRRRLIRGWDHEKTVSTPDKAGNCYKA